MPLGIRLGPIRIGLSDKGTTIGGVLGPLSASTTVPRRQHSDGSVEIAYRLDDLVRMMVDAGYRIDGRDADWALLVRGSRAVRLEATPHGTRAREVMPPAMQIGIVVAVGLVIGAVVVACFAGMFST